MRSCGNTLKPASLLSSIFILLIFGTSDRSIKASSNHGKLVQLSQVVSEM